MTVRISSKPFTLVALSNNRTAHFLSLGIKNWKTLVRNEFCPCPTFQFGILQHVFHSSTDTLWRSWYGWPCWCLRFGFIYQGRRVQSDSWKIGHMTRSGLEPKDSWTIFIFHKYWFGCSSGRQLVILSWSRDETCSRNRTNTSICFWILGRDRLYNWILGTVSYQSRSRSGPGSPILPTILLTFTIMIVESFRRVWNSWSERTISRSIGIFKIMWFIRYHSYQHLLMPSCGPHVSIIWLERWRYWFNWFIFQGRGQKLQSNWRYMTLILILNLSKRRFMSIFKFFGISKFCPILE